MKVKVLLNLGTNDYGADALPEGEHEVAESFGRLLVSRGHAVELQDEPKPVQPQKQQRKEPEVVAKQEARQGEVVATPSPVSVTPAKPDNFQKMRTEHQSKAESKASAETKKPTSNKES